MCPYMAGGRSRRGSPKAGTTVLTFSGICSYLDGRFSDLMELDDLI